MDRLPIVATLARVAEALDAVGVGLAVCGSNGAPHLENAAYATALAGRRERLIDALTQIVPAADDRPHKLPFVDCAVVVSLGANLVAIVVPGGLPAPERLRAVFGLSRRESEVALLLARRATTREIASELNISAHTARHHAERVLYKLGVTSRAQAAAQIVKLSPGAGTCVETDEGT